MIGQLSMCIATSIAVSAIGLVTSATLAADDKPTGGLRGGGPIKSISGPDGCITPAQLATMRERITANRIKLGLTVGLPPLQPEAPPAAPPAATDGGIAGVPPAPPFILPFYPMGGTIDSNLVQFNFNDVDPDPGETLDFNCMHYTYDGHWGIDTTILGFPEQWIGVPIYAALDGVIVDAHDGEPDMNLSCTGNANYVVIDHGSGYETIYFHLKNGSVAFPVGYNVKAGQQIGLTASSGCSTWPHLHFAVSKNGQTFEPYSGPCRTGPSNFLHQNPGDYGLRISDFGLTTVDLTTVPWAPFEVPAHGQMALSDPNIYIWLHFINMPAGATWRFRFIRPDSTLDYDTGRNLWNGGTEPWHTGGGWWYWNLPSMHAIAGLWHIDFLINDQLMVHAPLEVVATVNPNYNRPPKPITVSFDPPAPQVGEVVFCRTLSPSIIDDVDYDLVRYHYVWKVNGVVVRDVMTAGRADAVRRDAGVAGDTLECTVTPGDGALNGPPANVSAVLGGVNTCSSDLVKDGEVDVDDLLKVLLDWGPCP